MTTENTRAAVELARCMAALEGQGWRASGEATG